MSEAGNGRQGTILSTKTKSFPQCNTSQYKELTSQMKPIGSFLSCLLPKNLYSQTLLYQRDVWLYFYTHDHSRTSLNPILFPGFTQKCFSIAQSSLLSKKCVSHHKCPCPHIFKGSRVFHLLQDFYKIVLNIIIESLISHVKVFDHQPLLVLIEIKWSTFFLGPLSIPHPAIL